MDANLLTIVLAFVIGGIFLFAACAFVFYRLVGRRWLGGFVQKRISAERAEIDRQLAAIQTGLDRKIDREGASPEQEAEILNALWDKLNASCQAVKGYINYRMIVCLLDVRKTDQTAIDEKTANRQKELVEVYANFREYFLVNGHYLPTGLFLQMQSFIYELGAMVIRLTEGDDADFHRLRKELDGKDILSEKLIRKLLQARIGNVIETPLEK